MMRLLRVVLLCVCIASAHADDTTPRTMLRAHLEPHLEPHLAPSGTVTAGSAVTLVVDALTTAWFSAAPDWPLFEVRDAFVTLPDENAQNLNEVIDGVHWFGVRRAYRIVPRGAGRFDVPAFAIALHPGGIDTPVTMNTPALSFIASVPPGAENMATFFPAPNLAATQRITPGDGKLEVGQTITRIVTQRAGATQSMLIPPVAFGDIDGLRRYSKTPVTRDVTQDRAGLVAGERIDTVTYAVERRGHYTLPPIDIEWWNTSTQRREVIHLAALNFDARAAHDKPLWDIPADAIARHTIVFIDARDVVIVCIALACLIGGVGYYSHVRAWLARLTARLADARRRRAQGEGAAWRALRRAAQSGAMHRIVPALYRWKDARAVQSDAMQTDAPPELHRLADAVKAYYASDRADGRAVKVRLPLHIARRHRPRKEQNALPPLNEG
jgi:hypothetical protein